MFNNYNFDQMITFKQLYYLAVWYRKPLNDLSYIKFQLLPVKNSVYMQAIDQNWTEKWERSSKQHYSLNVSETHP